MKYSMVKQYAIRAVDNFFKFFYKIYDFGKVLIDVFWAFLEIWEAFFGIFINYYLYCYYLVLYLLDKGADTGSSFYYGRTAYSRRVSHRMKIDVPKNFVNPIPGQYKVKQTVSRAAEGVKDVAKAAADVGKATVSRKPSRGRRSLVKAILEGLFSFFEFIGRIVTAPFRLIFSGGGSKGTKTTTASSSGKSKGSGSLIEQYMKEFEGKRKG